MSRPVYSTKRENVPQATFGCPNCPHRPNLSATAERNERPSANRKNTELRLTHLLIAKGKTVCSKCLNEGRCDAGDKGVFIFIDPLLLTVDRLPTAVAGQAATTRRARTLFRMERRSVSKSKWYSNALDRREEEVTHWTKTSVLFGGHAQDPPSSHVAL